MKPGNLVTIYYQNFSSGSKKVFVDTVGLLMAVHGYKAEVLIDGQKEIWDISDLEKMEKDKNESR